MIFGEGVFFGGSIILAQISCHNLILIGRRLEGCFETLRSQVVTMEVHTGENDRRMDDSQVKWVALKKW